MTEAKNNGNINRDTRGKIAANLRAVRAIERNREFDMNRNGYEYLYQLKGLESFLNYVRDLSGSRILLDIGAGTTRGINDISKTSLGLDLDFKATGLFANPEVEQFLGKKNYTITSAETLRGIGANSIAGILAVNSIAYSQSPETVAKRLDQILIPGGAIKGSFSWTSYLEDISQNEGTIKSSKPFVAEFGRLGYDVAHGEDFSVMLAIKPGVGNIKAKSLFDQDRDSLDMQIKKYFIPDAPTKVG